jgi:hypothetical protein
MPPGHFPKVVLFEHRLKICSQLTHHKVSYNSWFISTRNFSSRKICLSMHICMYLQEAHLKCWRKSVRIWNAFSDRVVRCRPRKSYASLEIENYFTVWHSGSNQIKLLEQLSIAELATGVNIGGGNFGARVEKLPKICSLWTLGLYHICTFIHTYSLEVQRNENYVHIYVGRPHISVKYFFRMISTLDREMVLESQEKGNATLFLKRNFKVERHVVLYFRYLHV